MTTSPSDEPEMSQWLACLPGALNRSVAVDPASGLMLGAPASRRLFVPQGRKRRSRRDAIAPTRVVQISPIPSSRLLTLDSRAFGLFRDSGNTKPG